MRASEWKNVCVVGLQWGDEGKGQLIDILTARSDVVVRYNGGANAGHSIWMGDRKLGMHLVPSGILHERVTCVIANGVVLDPAVLFEEIDLLRGLGVKVADNLRISDRAHVVFPYHKEQDTLSEKALRDNKLGTTSRGIGPCYADKVHRSTGIRVGQLVRPDVFEPLLRRVVEGRNRLVQALYDAPGYDADEIIATYSDYARRLAPHVCDTATLLHDALDAGQRMLFEGAHGSLLDIDHGTYPFVTSSNASAVGVPTGSGVPERRIDTFLGIAKAYTTRVGTGPMPCELEDETGQKIRDRGNEYGTTTGRPRRCGWFDAVATGYSTRLGGIDCVALTALNVLSDFDPIGICVGYELDGRRIDRFCALAEDLGRVKPVVERVPGWGCDLSACRSWSDLPTAAVRYVERLEKLLGCPIACTTVGMKRDQVVWRDR